MAVFIVVVHVLVRVFDLIGVVRHLLNDILYEFYNSNPVLAMIRNGHLPDFAKDCLEGFITKYDIIQGLSIGRLLAGPKGS